MKIVYLLTKFGGHKYFGSGDIMLLVCNLISYDQVFNRSSDFVGGNSSFYVTTLPSLMTIRTALVAI